MAIIYDAFGNPKRQLAGHGGDSLFDSRPAATLSSVNSSIALDIANETSITVDISGTFVATHLVEYTMDGTNYKALPMFNLANELFMPSSTLVGVYKSELPNGTKTVRVRQSLYTSGVASVVLRATADRYITYNRPIPSVLNMTATAAVNTAVTLTLPAPGIGFFHYITYLEIVKIAAADLTAVATPLLITTTNLGATLPVFSFGQPAMLTGQLDRMQIPLAIPLRSVAANTVTSVVCPATPGVIWRANAFYYTNG